MKTLTINSRGATCVCCSMCRNVHSVLVIGATPPPPTRCGADLLASIDRIAASRYATTAPAATSSIRSSVAPGVNFDELQIIGFDAGGGLRQTMTSTAASPRIASPSLVRCRKKNCLFICLFVGLFQLSSFLVFFSPPLCHMQRRHSSPFGTPRTTDSEGDIVGSSLLCAHAFAVGPLADATLMRAFCARAALGELHAPTPPQLAATMCAVVARTLLTYMHSIVVRIKAESGVRVWPTVAAVPVRARTERETLAFVPTIALGERRQLPFQISIDRSDPGVVPLLTVSTSCLVSSSSGSRRLSRMLRVRLQRDASPQTTMNIDKARRVRREVLRCLLADTVLKAIYAADGGEV